jgi:4-amino-4-deoxy-L-arabinose transferase-like glycosyltransferase
MKISHHKVRQYLLIVILIAAAIMRLYHIDQPLIEPAASWRQSDTATIADNFYWGNRNIFLPAISWNGPGANYVGYEFQTVSYLAALLYRILGQHDWVNRGIAVAFGLWGIFALYQLIRLVWDEKHALAGAGIMALLPGSIWVDRLFLPDPAMVSLVVTSFWLLVVYLQTEKLHYLVLASLVGILGFLTKISGLIVGIPIIYVIFINLKHKHQFRSKKAFFICIASIFTLLPVIAYYLWAKHISLTYPPYHIGAAGNWLWDDGLYQWLSKKYYFPDMFHRHIKRLWTWTAILLTILGLFLNPYFLIIYYKNYPKCREDYDKPTDGYCEFSVPFLFHWWLLAGIIFYCLAAKELVYNIWNFHIITPAIAALTGHSIVVFTSFLSRFMRRYAAIATSLLLVLIFIMLIGQKNINSLYQPIGKESYQLGLALKQITVQSDYVITIAHEFGNPVAIYYSQRRGWVFPPANTWSKLDWGDGIKDDTEAIRLLEELRTQGADWLGIVNDQKNKIWKDNPKLVEYIEQRFELYQESPDWIIYRIPGQK